MNNQANNIDGIPSSLTAQFVDSLDAEKEDLKFEVSLLERRMEKTVREIDALLNDVEVCCFSLPREKFETSMDLIRDMRTILRNTKIRRGESWSIQDQAAYQN